MLFSFARTVVLGALLSPLVASLAVSPEHFASKRDYPTSCKNGPTTRGCWDGDLDIDTEMDDQWPNTGKTVKYSLEIVNTTVAPDGFERLGLLVNGQFPGPTLVADWGDYLEITVTNKLSINGTGLHWHGLRQLGSNEMDGVNGITECPIAPGETRVYRFQCTQYGTSWYHSHYDVQYAEGTWGTILINGPSTANYDVDLGVLPLTDWFHTPVFAVSAASFHASKPPVADNLLVNGSMTSTYGGKYAVTTLQKGKSHKLRLLNVGINNYMHVALDGHYFTVVAADFVPIVPYNATSISLTVGQRYDVIIHANSNSTNATSSADAGNYWLRVGTGGGQCDSPNANAANIRSIFRYEGAPETDPTTTASTPLPVGCYDETNLVPHVKSTVPQKTPEKLGLGFTNTAGDGSLIQWLIDGTPMLVSMEKPTIQSVAEGTTTFPKAANVFQVGGAGNQWQYWVIQQDSTAPPLPHPIHLHGHDFFILASAANSVWSGDISSLKMDNPTRRDTASLPGGGYLVLAFESDNPGAWLMHCHIPFHISAGFGLQFLENADQIVSKDGGSSGTGFTDGGCQKWKAFQSQYKSPWGVNGTLLIEGDSGL